MPDLLDPAFLPQIDWALAQSGWMPPVPAGLMTAFRSAGDLARRVNNRRVVCLLTLLFDLFWEPQFQATPDIVPLSGILRLAVFTPFTVLFCWLDSSGRLGRLYDPLLLLLAVAPCLITTFLCLMTAEMVAQPEIYGTPLILLYTGVLLRLRLPMVIANVAICTPAYILGVIACPMLPRDQIATAVFIQVVVSVAVVIFNVQLETRDRQVFLLTQNERIRRSLVAEQNRGLLRETQTDALTQLANRRCFDETLSIRWLEALDAGRPLALIMIDVDHFKKFNDCYGHVMGDNCLRRVAAALAGGTREVDMVARYGGEEFAVILGENGAQEALHIAERLQADVARLGLPHKALGPDAVVTISLGLAIAHPTSPHGARTLIETADRNLYAAKQAGRNRVSTGSPDGVAWRQPLLN